MIKNIVKVLMSNFILAGVGILTSFIFPIILNVVDYAYYQQYMLYLSYINICHLGIASGMFLNYAGKSYSSINKSQYKSEIYLIMIVLFLFTLTFLLISGATKSTILLYITLSIVPQCLVASFNSLYQSWGKFTEYSIINVIPKLSLALFVIGMHSLCQNIKANYMIIFYITILWILALRYIFEFILFTKGEKSNKIFSSKNIETTSTGFLITFGNYINIIFTSIDKQFVNIFFTTKLFAIYSFAMSMQNIMTIFITSIAVPLYTKLAGNKIERSSIKELKELLLIFGVYSGCAYFVVSLFVSVFVQKYIYALRIISIFFSVFPATAIIQVICINLYKIEKKLKQYIKSLIIMILISVVLNGIAVIFKLGVTGIATSTLISYYIWLLYSQKDFKYILDNRDYIFLFVYLLLYFTITSIVNNAIIGFVLYFFVITIINYSFYTNTCKKYIKKAGEKICQKK